MMWHSKKSIVVKNENEIKDNVDGITGSNHQSSTQTKQWYALYTRSRAEKKALTDLTDAGFECYVPLQKTMRQWSDRKKKVDMVAIPSYIFVYIEKHQQHDIFVSQHLIGYVRFEGKAAIIPDKQIEALKKIIETNTNFDISKHHIKPGMKVKIAYGTLAGIEGEFVKIARNKRFLLRIEQIGYTLSLQIPFDYLEFSDI